MKAILKIKATTSATENKIEEEFKSIYRFPSFLTNRTFVFQQSYRSIASESGYYYLSQCQGKQYPHLIKQ